MPMLFGGTAPAALKRMAGWGKGYIARAVPASMAASWFDAARRAWGEAGRHGKPYLVGTAYFALGSSDKGRANVYDHYSGLGTKVAQLTSRALADSATAVRDVVNRYGDLGIDELLISAATDDPDEVERLTEVLQ
ncbi:hypothetical protein ABT300_36530 [Streptomyces sp. NPDC001027]|uniref:hypothetical protein n=1 Tax=Streptomyces sp. NPDC001027 TaxID=3154771 RepID=UPI0033244D17